MSVSQRAVSEDEAEIRLDRWFRRHFPTLGQGAVQKMCRTGQIRVDGHRAEAGTRLLPGQMVRVPPLPTPPPGAPAMPAAPVPVDPRVRAELERMILYQDEQLIVIDKPFGLPVQGGPNIALHLDALVVALSRDGQKPLLVHRLDRDTSGVLLLARSPGVAAKLAAGFRGRDMEKTYWALVAGRPMPPQGRIDAALVRTRDGNGARSAIAERDDPAAARAMTDYRTLEHAARKLSWLELRPLTGRTHQLRVHCAALGTPIVGDPKYGVMRDPTWAARVEGFAQKLHLHARTLLLPHPGGGMLEVHAEPPAHMRESFTRLGFTIPSAPPPRRF